MNSFTTSFLRLGITFGLAATIPAFTDTIFDFELIPENKVLNTAVTIYAPPGGTTGWGYSLTNEDDPNGGDYLAITDVQPTTNLQHGNLDTSIFDFPILAPGQSVIVPWQQDTAGLGQFTWDANAPTPFDQGGQFVISAQWYTDDPNSCNYTCTEIYQTQTQELVPFDVSDTLLSGNTGSAPEPAAVWLLGSGLFVLAGLHKIRRAYPTSR